MSEFAVGDRVRKVKGYAFDGIIRAVFTNGAGDVRVVAELDRGLPADMLHIFSPNQLEKRDT